MKEKKNTWRILTASLVTYGVLNVAIIGTTLYTAYKTIELSSSIDSKRKEKLLEENKDFLNGTKVIFVHGIPSYKLTYQELKSEVTEAKMFYLKYKDIFNGIRDAYNIYIRYAEGDLNKILTSLNDYRRTMFTEDNKMFNIPRISEENIRMELKYVKEYNEMNKLLKTFDSNLFEQYMPLLEENLYQDKWVNVNGLWEPKADTDLKQNVLFATSKDNIRVCIVNFEALAELKESEKYTSATEEVRTKFDSLMNQFFDYFTENKKLKMIPSDSELIRLGFILTQAKSLLNTPSTTE